MVRDLSIRENESKWLRQKLREEQDARQRLQQELWSTKAKFDISRQQLHQERERAEQYRSAIADAYSQLPEIPNGYGCLVCHRFIFTIKDHKSSCLYRILDDALSK